MNAKSQANHSENQLSKIILDAAFRVHTKSGPGIERIVNRLSEEGPHSLGHKLLPFFASLAHFA